MFKVLSMKEFILSHVFLIGGLILLSVGLSLDIIGLNIAGIWCFAGGLCFAFSLIFAKLLAK